MKKISQKYIAEVSIYPPNKLSNGYAYLFKFKVNKETDTYSALDAIVHLDNQKTLSSSKPRQIDITSSLKLEDSGPISIGDRFSIYDDGKIGIGRIVEILEQE